MNKNVAFNVMLSGEDKARLSELSSKTGFSKGQVIRMSLENAWYMQCRSVLLCATGNPCMAPQMHSHAESERHMNNVAPALAGPAA